MMTPEEKEDFAKKCHDLQKDVHVLIEMHKSKAGISDMHVGAVFSAFILNLPEDIQATHLTMFLTHK